MKKLFSHIIAAVFVSLVVWVSGCRNLPHSDSNSTIVIQTPWGPRPVPNPRANVIPADEARMFAQADPVDTEVTSSLGKTNVIRVIK